jgi:hypothetical protein
MKTTSYNAVKEVRTGTLLIVSALSLFAVLKVNEPRLNGVNNSDRAGTEQKLVSQTNLPPSSVVPDAVRIEEPVPDLNVTKDLVYDASKFVDIDMALEREQFLNSSSKPLVETEPSLSAELRLNSMGYTPAEFVETEMALENQRWMNSFEVRSTDSR